MRHNRKGCIINITSVAGKISCTPLGAYAASKFALEGISEACGPGTEAIQYSGGHCRARHN